MEARRNQAERGKPLNAVANRTGLVCLILIGLLWGVSLPLHCARPAALVGVADALAGSLFGLFLAGVTRTRRPFLIYLWLGLAGLSLWPLFHSWPWLNVEDVPSEAAWNYLALLRLGSFVLGLPFPFARFGQHGPDPLPPHPPEPGQNAETEA